jgi:hypothetical protein
VRRECCSAAAKSGGDRGREGGAQGAPVLQQGRAHAGQAGLQLTHRRRQRRCWRLAGWRRQRLHPWRRLLVCCVAPVAGEAGGRTQRGRQCCRARRQVRRCCCCTSVAGARASRQRGRRRRGRQAGWRRAGRQRRGLWHRYPGHGRCCCAGRARCRRCSRGVEHWVVEGRLLGRRDIGRLLAQLLLLRDCRANGRSARCVGGPASAKGLRA